MPTFGKQTGLNFFLFSANCYCRKYRDVRPGLEPAFARSVIVKLSETSS